MLIGGRKILPVIGTTRRLVDCGQALHPVPDDEVFDRLIPHIEDTAGLEGPWYAVVMLSNGQGQCGGLVETSRRPPDDVFERMVDLAIKMNRECHHNGHWIIAYSNGWISGVWRAWVQHKTEDKRSAILIETDLAETWERARLWSLEEMMARLDGGYAEGIERYHQH